MASINDGELYLGVKDASEDQLRRGITAARASFEQSGVPIGDAFLAAQEREMRLELAVSPPVTEAHQRAVAAFNAALSAAIAASDADRCTFLEFSEYLELVDYDAAPDSGPHYELARPDPRARAMTV